MRAAIRLAAFGECPLHQGGANGWSRPGAKNRERAAQLFQRARRSKALCGTPFLRGPVRFLGLLLGRAEISGHLNGPSPGYLMSPPTVCRPLSWFHFAARGGPQACASCAPRWPLRPDLLPPLSLAPSPVAPASPPLAVGRPFPRPQGSDTIPIARRLAVQFNPYYPAGQLPWPWAYSARGPPDKSLFVR
jgi:hypothetical protein